MTLYHKEREMELLDIHTHNDSADKNTAILNCAAYIADRNISLGIHPWHITDEWEQTLRTIRENATRENVKAIGECGIDKTNATADIEIQNFLFRAHATLAEEVEKPLIIHCVKSVDEIIGIYKEIKPRQAWIIHGFRGKPQQALQLTKAGIYISFGEKHNPDSIKATPLDRMFVESDESSLPISEIYSRIAYIKECPVEDLAISVLRNAEKCNIALQ